MTKLERIAAAKAEFQAARARKDTRAKHEAAECLKSATTAQLHAETRRPWWWQIATFFQAMGLA